MITSGTPLNTTNGISISLGSDPHEGVKCQLYCAFLFVF